MDEKKLKKLIKLCQKEGITSIKTQEVELHFGQKPKRPPRPTTAEAIEEQTQQYTDEDVLEWSSRGVI